MDVDSLSVDLLQLVGGPQPGRTPAREGPRERTLPFLETFSSQSKLENPRQAVSQAAGLPGLPVWLLRPLEVCTVCPVVEATVLPLRQSPFGAPGHRSSHTPASLPWHTQNSTGPCLVVLKHALPWVLPRYYSVFFLIVQGVCMGWGGGKCFCWDNSGGKKNH